jgi:phosphoribosylanthranilate isomerase
MYIKLCGMTREEDVAFCATLGIDAVGLVVEYPVAVPWNLARSAACRLRQAAPPGLDVVLVCAGAGAEIADLADHIGPTAVQLHGDESLAETARLAQMLQSRRIPLYRALRIDPGTGLAAGEVSDPVAAAQALAATGVAALVVDSHIPSRPGGTGVPVDVTTLSTIKAAVTIPVIVAGGLTPHNVGRVIAQVRPDGVDVLTGVETSPTVKNHSLMRAFCRAARSAAAALATNDRGPGSSGPLTGHQANIPANKSV